MKIIKVCVIALIKDLAIALPDGRDSNAAKNILIKGQPEFLTVYRAWAWEHGETRKPGSDSSTECHQEAKTNLLEIAPSPEYGDLTTQNPSLSSDACHDSVSDIPKAKNKRKDTKKQQLSESQPKTFTQLTLW